MRAGNFLYRGTLPLWLAAVLGLGSTAAFALPGSLAEHSAEGPKDGGGGKGLRCRENGREVIYLADTYALMHAENRDLLTAGEPGSVLLAAAEWIERTHPEKVFAHPYTAGEKVSLAWLIEHQRNVLSFEITKKDELPDFADDHLVPPANCVKVQIAIQHLATGIVETDYKLTSALTFLERGFLELHEVLIAIRHAPGADTTPIRGHVGAIANVLNDPRLAFYALAKQILSARNRQRHSATAAEDSLFKDCKSMLIDPVSRPGDSAETTFCRRVSAEIIAAAKTEDRSNALETILEFPSRLSCRVSFTGKSKSGWVNPGTVLLERVTGSGLPGTISTARISFAAGAMPERASNNNFFATYRHSRDGGFRPHGGFRYSNVWSIEGGATLGLHLDQYTERTRELTGSLQLSEPPPRSPYDVDVFGVVCDGTQVRFGIDMEHSVSN